MHPPSYLSDTHPKIRQIMIEGYRRMTPDQKMRCVSNMTIAVQKLALARIRNQYGEDIPEREARLRLASLWLDRETMVKVFGWDPKKEGY